MYRGEWRVAACGAEGAAAGGAVERGANGAPMEGYTSGSTAGIYIGITAVRDHGARFAVELGGNPRIGATAAHRTTACGVGMHLTCGGHGGDTCQFAAWAGLWT